VSGNWNAAKSVLPKNYKPADETLPIKASAPDIEFRYKIGGIDSVKAYRTDHKEMAMPQMPNGSLLAKAYWKNAILIIETQLLLKIDNPSFNNSEILHTKSSWKMSDDGRMLTETTESDERRTVEIYEKQ
jgi:hypothetical protein